MNSANRDQLLQEYAENKRQPLQMKINNENVIIPVEYALSGSAEEVQKRFLRDYFDEQKKEWTRYKQAGIQPRKIEMNGAVYVVPYKLRDSKRKDTEVVELVLKRANAKYNRAISLTRKMNKAFPERKYTVEVSGEHTSNLQTAYNRYLVEKYKHNAKVAAIKTVEFIAGGVRLMGGKKSPFNMQKIADGSKKLAVGSLLVGTAAIGSYGAYHLVKKNQANKNETEEMAEMTAEFEEENTLSADFTEAAEKSSDKKTTATKKATAKKDVFKVGPAPAKKAKFERTKTEQDKLFKKFVADIFKSEGGYADKKIDQPTNMGIIQPTLNVYRQRFPKEAAKLNFPVRVKGLKRSQALQVYRRLYFDQYKIGDYRNESIGMLIFDIYVNHEPATAKLFVDQALKAARKAGADVKLPSTTQERVAVINSLAEHPKGEAAFYEQIMKERRYHMYKRTTLRVKRGEIKESRFAAGLRNRANKYNDRYVATGFQEQKAGVRVASNGGR